MALMCRMSWVPSRLICRILSSAPDLGLKRTTLTRADITDKVSPQSHGELVYFLYDELVIVHYDPLTGLSPFLENRI